MTRLECKHTVPSFTDEAGLKYCPLCKIDRLRTRVKELEGAPPLYKEIAALKAERDRVAKTLSVCREDRERLEADLRAVVEAVKQCGPGKVFTPIGGGRQDDRVAIVRYKWLELQDRIACPGVKGVVEV